MLLSRHIRYRPSHCLQIRNQALPSGLPPSPTPVSAQTIRSQHNAASLAFLGDAVWEVFLRQRYFGSGRQPLHAYNVSVKRHAGAVQQVEDEQGYDLAA